ncbi:MAG TPA: hypothetical protein ENJ18_15330 [Nannocystis exedens]|nr:hypothetical protein [Nannocystis exedens]
MAFLARKVARPKWMPLGGSPQIQADAIACDLRTSGNTLSFWRFPSANDELFKNAALALVSTWQRLDKIDLIAIPENVLLPHVKLRETPGATAVADLRSFHVDAVELSIESLCLVARELAKEIRREGGMYRRLPKKSVLHLIREAIEQRRLNPADLDPGLRTKVYS